MLTHFLSALFLDVENQVLVLVFYLPLENPTLLAKNGKTAPLYAPRDEILTVFAKI